MGQHTNPEQHLVLRRLYALRHRVSPRPSLTHVDPYLEPDCMIDRILDLLASEGNRFTSDCGRPRNHREIMGEVASMCRGACRLRDDTFVHGELALVGVARYPRLIKGQPGLIVPCTVVSNPYGGGQAYHNGETWTNTTRPHAPVIVNRVPLKVAR